MSMPVTWCPCVAKATAVVSPTGPNPTMETVATLRRSLGPAINVVGRFLRSSSSSWIGEHTSIRFEEERLHGRPVVLGLKRGSTSRAHPGGFGGGKHERLQRPLQRAAVTVTDRDATPDLSDDFGGGCIIGDNDGLREHHRLEELVRSRELVVR